MVGVSQDTAMTKSEVKRKQKIRRYAGFPPAAGDELIETLTLESWKLTRERVRAKRYDTGALYRSIRYNIRKGYGAIIAGGPGAKHAHLVQYGARGGNMPKLNYMTYGYNKVRREMQRLWKAAVGKAYGKQAR